MKRTLFKSIFLTVCLGLFIAMPAMAAPSVDLVLTNEIGSSFDLEVWADADGIGEELLAFGFDVSFDNGGDYLLTGYSLGAGFDDLSMGGGNVVGDAFPGISTDPVLLSILSFDTVGAGTDTINIIGFADGMFSGLVYELSFFDIDASITPGGAEVPVPATIFLLGGGLMGLVGTRKSRKR